jgi:hypothetical protein
LAFIETKKHEERLEFISNNELSSQRLLEITPERERLLSSLITKLFLILEIEVDLLNNQFKETSNLVKSNAGPLR